MRVGIDEAGKGPVLGPMVAAAVGVADAAALPDGVADSKRLAPERREELCAHLCEDDRVAVGVATVGVERIDAPETDMNSLTVAVQAAALDAVRGVDANPTDATLATVDSGWERLAAESERSAGSGSSSDGTSAGGDSCEVLADAGDTSEERFARRLAERCAGEPAVAARHGADDDDPVVAAASIVAKVERDARVAALAEAYGDVGSGYPSDPTTRRFLAEFVEERDRLPDCARESWQTCADVLAAAEQSGLEDF